MHLKDKIATAVFWFVAGGLILLSLSDLALALWQLRASEWGSAEAWLVLALAFALLVLCFGVRQCYRSLKFASRAA